jgi:hypothetical protein
MIVCNKCRGKVFVDLTFTDNRNYETFCLCCGKRTFIGPSHPLFEDIREYVRSALVA